jgi:uncharacterized protein (TIGR03085 family)
VPSHAAAERLELAATLAATDPLAPTLDPPWRAQELAAHLVLRGRSPRYGAAMAIPRLQGKAAALQDELVASRSYEDLVSAIAAGPRLAPTRIGAIDDAVNLIEYVVHHEDVRRAATSWEPRALPADRLAALWARLRTMSRTMARSAVRDLRLEPTNLIAEPIAGSRPTVVVRGAAVELVLVALGRARAARIELAGDDADIQRFREAQRMP